MEAVKRLVVVGAADKQEGGVCCKKLQRRSSIPNSFHGHKQFFLSASNFEHVKNSFATRKTETIKIGAERQPFATLNEPCRKKTFAT